MTAKRKTKWAFTPAGPDLDALGCYKKHVKKGIYVTVLHIAEVPVRLKRRYAAAVRMNGDTQRRSMCRFMEAYAKEIEKKFNVFLDPEFPEGYDPTH